MTGVGLPGAGFPRIVIPQPPSTGESGTSVTEVVEKIEKGEIPGAARCRFYEKFIATLEHPVSELPATQFMGDRVSLTLEKPALIHVYFTLLFESGGAGVVEASLVVNEEIVRRSDNNELIQSKLDPAGAGEGNFYVGMLAPSGSEQLFHVVGEKGTGIGRRTGLGVPLWLEAGKHKVDVQFSLTGPETAHKAIKTRRLMVTVMESA